MKQALFSILLFAVFGIALAKGELRVGVFDVDAGPEVGSELAYEQMDESGTLGLRARGFVLLGSGEPIVICAVDWIGIGNAGHDAFRDALATAAGTTRQRVAVQALHPHDAPFCDFTAAKILEDLGRDAPVYRKDVTRPTIERAAQAVQAAVKSAQPLTHISTGSAEVHKVASNRRLMGADGMVEAVRFTATKDPKLQAAPEGLIDPLVRVVGLWNDDELLTVLSYYATHPQSYYRTGIAYPDLPGIARFLREVDLQGVLHVHFTGAGGNIGAGKYNSGTQKDRMILAQRLADGMKRAWESAEKKPLSDDAVEWQVERVFLQPRANLNEAEAEAYLQSEEGKNVRETLLGPAGRLAWIRRCKERAGIDISCLRLGDARIIHLPGEPFVEYQLAAADMQKNSLVCVAGYGDYGPGYIGTAKSYSEGDIGYETQERSSFVGPEAEQVLMDAMQKLLAE